MDVLISDDAHAATSQKVKDILHMYCIESHASEPHHQHQNFAECCIGLLSGGDFHPRNQSCIYK